MTWKEKVKRVCAIEDEAVQQYLERMGFEEGLMSPSYTSKGSKKQMVNTLEEPCMRLDTEKRKTGNQIIVFINSEEAYLEEIENDFKASRNAEKKDGLFKRSNYVKIKDGLTMENVDKILDELMQEEN